MVMMFNIVTQLIGKMQSVILMDHFPEYIYASKFNMYSLAAPRPACIYSW